MSNKKMLSSMTVLFNHFHMARDRLFFRGIPLPITRHLPFRIPDRRLKDNRRPGRDKMEIDADPYRADPVSVCQCLLANDMLLCILKVLCPLQYARLTCRIWRPVSAVTYQHPIILSSSV